jgi:hypothetical protein
MILESKTTKQICQLTDIWYDNGSIASNFLEQKWVPLEDAQKEISTLQEYSKFWGGFAAKLNVENQKLEAKIEAANNILRYIEKDPNLFKYWKTEFQQLKEVLQFPRKEEAKNPWPTIKEAELPGLQKAMREAGIDFCENKEQVKQ